MTDEKEKLHEYKSKHCVMGIDDTNCIISTNKAIKKWELAE